MASSKKTAVVTGASSGIGAVYADRLAARGYDLVIVARRADRLAALSKDLASKHGVTVRTVVADLAKSDDVRKVEAVLREDASIEVLVNNAGLARLGSAVGAAAEGTAEQIAVNIVALTSLTQAVLPLFKQRDAGTIINVASVLALHALPISAIYSGTKGYVLNYTRGIQDELAASNSKVRVQAVLPASTATEIWSEKVSGVPLEALAKETVMSAEDCVDAALRGLDQGELVTLPSVENDGLLKAYDVARTQLFAATQTGKPASRYGVA